MIFKLCIFNSSLCTCKLHDCQVDMSKVMANFPFYNFEPCYLFENCKNAKADIR